MRKKIVAGNWKMNGSKESISQLLKGIKSGAEIVTDITWIVFPPFPFIEQVGAVLLDTNVAWGAQNMSEKASGAYAGEVSAAMLKEFGCQYVLVGHSERRSLFAETDELVANKFLMAVNSGLIPILCVGETLEERENGLTQQVVNRQISAILNLENGVHKLSRGIIAYEPVWAIGTGITATPEQAQEVHSDIRKSIAAHDTDIANALSILYGGSVKPDNAKTLFAMSDIDGGLIGGASLNAKDFIEIGESCSK